jgi:hypothetical protein
MSWDFMRVCSLVTVPLWFELIVIYPIRCVGSVGIAPPPENSTVVSPLGNFVMSSSSAITRNSSSHGIFSSQRPNPRRYECWTCGKSYDRPSRLKNHTNNHLGLKPYECLGRCGLDEWQVHVFRPLSRILTSLQHCCFLFQVCIREALSLRGCRQGKMCGLVCV